MILTDDGKKLYSQIKDSINTLTKSDSLFYKCLTINLGIHINMPSNIYTNRLSKFYEKTRIVLSIY